MEQKGDTGCHGPLPSGCGPEEEERPGAWGPPRKSRHVRINSGTRSTRRDNGAKGSLSFLTQGEFPWGVLLGVRSRPNPSPDVFPE